MDKKIIIIILAVIVLVLILSFSLKAPQEITVITDKSEYVLGEEPIMTIKNNLTDNVCFSACYPYYLEKMNGEWKKYLYEECRETDLVERCIEPGQIKGFELITYAIEPGPHRIVVPACIDCQVGEDFREDEIFYSNEFTIK